MAKDFGVGIIGLGSCLPDRVYTNFDLEKFVDTDNQWIVERTGIHERRIADENTATSDLSYVAAKRALDSSGLIPEDIDLVIVATVTPDMVFPSTACIVQSKLGAFNAAAFDLEAGCSGFVYGLTVGVQFIENGFYNNVMVIGAETLSKIINWEDRKTCVLFGDGAGAAVLSKVSKDRGIKASIIGADGEKGNVLNMPAGGSRRPASKETVDAKLHSIFMDGSEVFKFASRVMSKASVDVVEKAGYKIEDVDFLVPHQANVRIIDSAAKRLKLSDDKVFVNLHKYGNMSAASIPVALEEALNEGKIKDGDKVVLVGFGAGLTWASNIMVWGR